MLVDISGVASLAASGGLAIASETRKWQLDAAECVFTETGRFQWLTTERHSTAVGGLHLVSMRRTLLH